DFDGDGDVDGNDFLAWQRNASVGSLGDWAANFGQPASNAAAAATPEPTTLLQCLICLGGGARRRRSPRGKA
ncbi:MAG: hypothetical protein KDA61_02970, partial [Planctomycetales bacterium]|nr:hypothetical protein [Planctomycetales bacterium]